MSATVTTAMWAVWTASSIMWHMGAVVWHMPQAIQVVDVQAIRMMRMQAILMQGITVYVQTVKHLKCIAMMMTMATAIRRNQVCIGSSQGK